MNLRNSNMGFMNEATLAAMLRFPPFTVGVLVEEACNKINPPVDTKYLHVTSYFLYQIHATDICTGPSASLPSCKCCVRVSVLVRCRCAESNL